MLNRFVLDGRLRLATLKACAFHMFHVFVLCILMCIEANHLLVAFSSVVVTCSLLHQERFPFIMSRTVSDVCGSIQCKVNARLNKHHEEATSMQSYDACYKLYP